MERYGTAVVIGRWQLFHNNHLQLIRKALEVADRVLVLIGSANAATSIKNPFTWFERAGMINDCVGEEAKGRIEYLPLHDSVYNDSLWVTQVQRKVNEFAKDPMSICIVGAYSDDSSYYLKYFPQWDFVPFTGDNGVHATELRNTFFNPNCGLNDLKKDLPEAVFDYLKGFMSTTCYQNLVEEAKHIEQYKQMWAQAPFPVTFVTVDAVVLQQGHVLVVKRKSAPGKGLWALPGGFLKSTETCLVSAVRELKEETRIAIPTVKLLQAKPEAKVFDFPKRSLRGRTITHAFCWRLEGDELPAVKGSDDAEKAFWIPFSEVYSNENKFFEDHAQIIQHFITVGGK